jgi:hypothetical protein
MNRLRFPPRTSVPDAVSFRRAKIETFSAPNSPDLQT